MNENEQRVLSALKAGGLDSVSIAKKTGLEQSTLGSVLAKLDADGLVALEKSEESKLELTGEGRKYSKQELPERRLIGAIKARMLLDDAVKKAGLAAGEKGIALSWARKNNWIAISSEGGKAFVQKTGDNESADERALKEISGGKKGRADVLAAKNLVARSLVKVIGEKSFSAKLTKKGAAQLTGAHDAGGNKGVVTSLTAQILKSGEWKGRQFAEYDLNTLVSPVSISKKHFYKEFLNRMKMHLVGMGFREIRSTLVETEFWNMDALFMPQDHPAREIHDIFRLNYKGILPHPGLTDKVVEAHERGLAGSRGWGYKYSKDKASQVIARSHDTGISARELVSNLKCPDKVFFVAHVFRPDEIDWKHFIEFNQLGGYVVDESISLPQLMGYLKSFAVDVCGAKNVKFAPSYFPFTEPSCEMMAEINGKWVELGGAGIFRPEMLAALGVDKPVIAWGLGLDRLAMLYLGINDMRELATSKIELLKQK
ncbi:phenylalanine--tRNA ligase subunit alpha [Candidatus Micrarchaeota archaeon]|nr:phenylalanine--tRNA ligase subunit alpha [Candidatus Micrarchaeota archaeon]